MNNNKKILIIRFGAIGDVVHSSALFRSIKKSNPKNEIHYLTFKTPSTLLEADPDITKLWIAEKKSYSYLISLAKQLKEIEYDLIINLHPSIRTKIFCAFIKAKKVLTYKKTFKKHAVENFLDTAKPLFENLKPDKNLKIYLKPEDIKEAKQLIQTDKVNICLNIGANFTRQGRRWSISHWKQLSQKLIQKYNCNIILTGSQEDKVFADEILKESEQIFSFCGKLSLNISCAVISLCDIMISGDTGPLHIATASGVKSIGLYGAMPINRTGPFGENNFSICSDMKCVPCNKRKCKFTKKNDLNTPCMEAIKPEQILDIIEKENLITKHL